MQFSGVAHLIAGTEVDIPRVLSLLSESNIEVEGNPDLYVRSYTHFGIDEARELRERANSKSIGDRRVFVIAAPTLTSEAQHALLKTLEEPPAGALFLFVVASPDTMLATLRSRTHTITLANSSVQGLVDMQNFLANNPRVRLELLKPLFEKDSDDRRDLSAILVFLSQLESALSKHNIDTRVKVGLEAVYRARGYIADKGSLVKPLLEQTALLVPVIKI